MAKQELDENVGLEKAVSSGGGWKGAVISIFKFILSIILLPLVIGLTKSFFSQLIQQKEKILTNFGLGIAVYLILHIFIYEPRRIYDLGQKIIGKLFSFFAPLGNILYCCLPIYATIFFVLYLVLKPTYGNEEILGYLIFLFSFSSLMHLIFTASYLKEGSVGVLRGNYFFSLFLVYIFEIILVALFLKFITSDFSYTKFLTEGFSFFTDALASVCRQLFVMRPSP